MEQSGKIFSYDNIFPFGAYKLPVGEIFQVGELSVMSGCEIAEHVQYCDEITYAISGKARFYSEDECCQVTGGQVHFIKKGKSHKIVAEENFRYICIGIDANHKFEAIKSYIDKVKSDWFVAEDDGNIRKLTELIINEFYSRDKDSDTMINAYIIQILISLSRLIGEGTFEIRKNYNYNTSQATIFHLMTYIDREYLNIKNVKSIADHLSYSEYYLSHLFKEKIGVSIKEYILRKKIMTAAELLQTTNLSISDISEYLNFGTPHTFCQAFKRILSQSPTEYKKSNSKF